MGGSPSLGVALVVGCSVALAGCLSSPQPLQTENPPADDGPAPAGAPVPTPPAVPAPGAAALVPVETAISYQGNTGDGLCVFAAVLGQCMGVQPGTEDFHELDVPGEPQRLTASVSWEAATPATGTLHAYLMHQEGDAWYWREGDPMAQGASPLPLDWDLTPYAGMGLALVINSFQGTGVAVVFVGGEMDQAFAVEGVVTSLAPAAPPAP